MNLFLTALRHCLLQKMERSIEITPRGFHWGRIFCLPFLEKSRALTFELLIVLKYF